MLNIRKKFFLFVMILGLGFTLVSCIDEADKVTVKFSEKEYTMALYQTTTLNPIINKGANVGQVNIQYVSSDDSVVSYENGILEAKAVGQVIVKAIYTEKTVIYAQATITVVKDPLPEMIIAEQTEMFKNATRTIEVELVDNYTKAEVAFEALTPELATITADGKVTAIAVGTAKFKATVSDAYDSASQEFEIEIVESDFAIEYILNGGIVEGDGNPVGYNVLELPLELIAPTRDGYTFLGWKLNNDKVVQKVPAGTLGNITLEAQWKLTEYKINYHLDGGENNAANPATFTIEDLPVQLVAPTKQYYTFLGWYILVEEVEVEVTEIVAATRSDVDVYAKWEALPCEITYDLDGGENNEDNPATITAEEEFVLLDPSKENHKFLGWYLNDEKIEKIEKGTVGAITLVAKWEIYFGENLVILDANGLVKTLEEALALAKAGYTIQVMAGTYAGNATISINNLTIEGPNKGISPNIGTRVEEATFTGVITIASGVSGITFEGIKLADNAVIKGQTAGGINNIIVRNVLSVTKLAAASAVLDFAVDAGKRNSNFSIENSRFVLAEGITRAAPRVIRAGGLTNFTFVDNYAESYLNGHDTDDLSDALRLGGEGAAVGASGGNGLSGEVLIYGNTFAKWGQFTININHYSAENIYIYNNVFEECSHDGSTQNASYGVVIDLNSYVKLSGVMTTINIKWNDFNNCSSNNNIIRLGNQGATSADWAANVNYNKFVGCQQGEFPQTVIINNRSKTAEAKINANYNYYENLIPTAANFVGVDTFVGWYSNIEDVPAYDEEQPAVYYDIEYDTDGGQLPEEYPNQYQESIGLATLPVPTKEGYIFLGWYVGEEKVTAIAKNAEGDFVLKAKWEKEPNKWNIEYDTDGGQMPEEYPNQYVEGVGLAQLPIPTKAGHTFLGWYIGEEKVTFISETEAADVALTAKWEENPETEFGLVLNLDGGDWEKVGFYTREEMVAMFVADIAAYFSVIAEKEVVISATEDLPDNVTDFMGVSYNYANDIAGFFTENAAKWGWMMTYIGKYATDLSTTTLVRANIHAFLYQTSWGKWPYSYNFSNSEVANGFWDSVPTFEEYVAPTSYDNTVVTQLPVPVKEGYIFLGWFVGSTQYEEIAIGTTGDLELTAKWRKDYGDQQVLVVGEGGDYATLDEALAEAEEGAIIRILPGTYVGGTVNVNDVIIEGANVDLNPNKDARGDESIFTGDIIVAADGVTINGIQLTGEGRIVGSPTVSFSDLTIKCVLVAGTTLNPATTNSTNAPLYFITTIATVVYTNIVLESLKFEQGQGRSMIMYATHVNNFTVKNSAFYGTDKAWYNDGFKFHSAAAGDFDIKGEVLFEGNHFENFGQYTLWLRYYGVGTYNIVNNTFKNCSMMETYTASIMMSFYTKEAGLSTTINVQYNKYENAGVAARIQSNGATADDLAVNVNYNKIYKNAKSAQYITNNGNGEQTATGSVSTVIVIDGTNNYYDFTPEAKYFGGTTWNPYYTKETDVPEYGEGVDVFGIDYITNGGELGAGTVYKYDSRFGLETLVAPTKVGYVFLGWYLDGEVITSIEVGTTGRLTLEAKWREDAIYVGTEDYCYATIAEALAVAKAGDKIIILAGTYDESFTVSVADLKIYGPNANVNPNEEERAEEAVLTGTITVAASAKNLVLNGLAFTGAANIRNASAANLSGFQYVYNYAYDTTPSANTWEETNAYTYGFIYFAAATGSEIKNFVFANNLFDSVSETNINLSWSKDVTFDNNVFNNFDRDAIRFNNGGYNYGILAFTNNEFTRDTLGGYNGIYFRIYGGPGPNDTIILIQGNVFKNIGTAGAGTSQIYSGAISARNYQEKGTDIRIFGNQFETCYQYINLRNNGTAANHAASVWACEVTGNNFIGVPTGVYFRCRNASDGTSTNPTNTVFGANYYADADGVALESLDSSKFQDVKSQAAALAEAVAIEVVAGVYFYSISYELDGGKATGLVTTYNRLSNTIVLPEPTKTNHTFMGWSLNGTIVTEITSEMSGDLMLVAEWMLIEGDYYTITYNYDKGNLPTRNALNRQEIVDELFTDYYNWAVKYDGYTGTYEAFCKDSNGKYSGGYWYKSINEKMRNASSKLVDESGENKFFMNTPEYYYKWIGFFEIFNEAMIAVNPGQIFFTDTYAAMIRIYQFADPTESQYNNYYGTAIVNRMCAALQLPTDLVETYRGGEVVQFGQLWLDNGLQFLGWYDNPEFNGEPLTGTTVTTTGNIELYAKWEPDVMPTSFIVENEIDEILLYETHQFIWTFDPGNTTDQRLEFISSNENVLTVSSKGLLTAVSEGTATITIKVFADRSMDKTYEIRVYKPDRIEIEYETTSYVDIDDEITLNAYFAARDPQEVRNIIWSSSNPEIATVVNGVVTGVSAGYVLITATVDGKPELNISVGVTVIEGVNQLSDVLAYLVSQHVANPISQEITVTGYQFVYKHDLLGSVNKFSFSELPIDRTKYMVPEGTSNRPGNIYDKYYVVVHDTASSATSGTSATHGNYLVGGGGGTSWHYSVGDDMIYQSIPDNEEAWHAGDGGRAYTLTNSGLAAGLPNPKVTISADGYYELNGQKSDVLAPRYQVRQKDSSGNYVKDAQGNYVYKIDRLATTSEINDQGIRVVIKDGNYYFGNTYFNDTYLLISNGGGNKHSIGMETMVNLGSDIYLTWHNAAKLTADLLVKYDFTLDDFKPHQYFSGKNCPQTMRDNGLYGNFSEMVAAEYEIAKKYADYTITFESSNLEYLSNNGRIIKRPTVSIAVDYTITVSKDGVSQSIKLSSIIPGFYS